ncbi:hypothetical protein SAMN00017405_0309 [Desulfonispora thiosulfatigenes DSM 11270]|uniref:Prepilin-type N-terminal cleavage/methylation domain-containing protein n=1 Tax=Desulfonispora thiosulfatigenes DSM 11270 TaxID=656914 RepID=A0A1W1VNR6_DESTI|nr:prepilin-type N-terminal cleavage/methylation domain-containing protein [Desulfonispora thiosulfatigenes]SMB95012.1 hypothetical protein SAMN00017405_0309 [Desulfonispora thiosulfatigenes DSM 11270]
MFKDIKNSQGITLIEIILSLAILGIIIYPISTLFITSINSNIAARDYLTATQLAQKYMEKVVADPTYYMNMTEKKTTEIEGDLQVIVYEPTEVSKGYDFHDSGISATKTINASNISDGYKIVFDNSNIESTKIICDANTIKTISIANDSDQLAKIYMIYPKGNTNRVFINILKGKVAIFENLEELDSINENKNTVYKLKVQVKKDDTMLTELVRLKTID